MSTSLSVSSLTPAPAALDGSRRQQLERVVAQLPLGSGAQTGTGARSPGPEELLAPVQQINATLKNHGVKFELSGEPPQTVARIVDLDTGDLIRQIPSEEVLVVAERLEEVRGLLFNEQT
ncbi:flagellar protein FlaG [Kineobactrum salinum]|uniref:Flagellar protein FlaG n=1 Tax=Kineobactrum salinum TaxID=2708301 RepID=A0A6C0TY46_9GAMM|nr:flagellar protein FlaG [Kineobactrum salinum]QIB64319.1 flagellar protein FlaG [Kineobactrum salinum]